jgi:hypothetical protein
VVNNNGKNRKKSGQPPALPALPEHRPAGMTDVSWRRLLRIHPTEEEQEIFIYYWNALHEDFDLNSGNDAMSAEMACTAFVRFELCMENHDPVLAREYETMYRNQVRMLKASRDQRVSDSTALARGDAQSPAEWATKLLAKAAVLVAKRGIEEGQKAANAVVPLPACVSGEPDPIDVEFESWMDDDDDFKSESLASNLPEGEPKRGRGRPRKSEK